MSIQHKLLPTASPNDSNPSQIQNQLQTSSDLQNNNNVMVNIHFQQVAETSSNPTSFQTDIPSTQSHSQPQQSTSQFQSSFQSIHSPPSPYTQQIYSSQNHPYHLPPQNNQLYEHYPATKSFQPNNSFLPVAATTTPVTASTCRNNNYNNNNNINNTCLNHDCNDANDKDSNTTIPSTHPNLPASVTSHPNNIQLEYSLSTSTTQTTSLPTTTSTTPTHLQKLQLTQPQQSLQPQSTLDLAPPAMTARYPPIHSLIDVSNPELLQYILPQGAILPEPIYLDNLITFIERRQATLHRLQREQELQLQDDSSTTETTSNHQTNSNNNNINDNYKNQSIKPPSINEKYENQSIKTVLVNDLDREQGRNQSINYHNIIPITEINNNNTPSSSVKTSVTNNSNNTNHDFTPMLDDDDSKSISTSQFTPSLTSTTTTINTNPSSSLTIQSQQQLQALILDASSERQICDFFIRAGLNSGINMCFKGNDCKYHHPPLIAPNGTRSKQICRLFLSKYGCLQNRECNQLHPPGRISETLANKLGIRHLQFSDSLNQQRVALRSSLTSHQLQSLYEYEIDHQRLLQQSAMQLQLERTQQKQQRQQAQFKAQQAAAHISQNRHNRQQPPPSSIVSLVPSNNNPITHSNNSNSSSNNNSNNNNNNNNNNLSQSSQHYSLTPQQPYSLHLSNQALPLQYQHESQPRSQHDYSQDYNSPSNTSIIQPFSNTAFSSYNNSDNSEMQYLKNHHHISSLNHTLPSSIHNHAQHSITQPQQQYCDVHPPIHNNSNNFNKNNNSSSSNEQFTQFTHHHQLLNHVQFSGGVDLNAFQNSFGQPPPQNHTSSQQSPNPPSESPYHQQSQTQQHHQQHQQQQQQQLEQTFINSNPQYSSAKYHLSGLITTPTTSYSALSANTTPYLNDNVDNNLYDFETDSTHLALSVSSMTGQPLTSTVSKAPTPTAKTKPHFHSKPTDRNTRHTLNNNEQYYHDDLPTLPYMPSTTHNQNNSRYKHIVSTNITTLNDPTTPFLSDTHENVTTLEYPFSGAAPMTMAMNTPGTTSHSVSLQNGNHQSRYHMQSQSPSHQQVYHQGNDVNYHFRQNQPHTPLSIQDQSTTFNETGSITSSEVFNPSIHQPTQLHHSSSTKQDFKFTPYQHSNE